MVERSRQIGLGTKGMAQWWLFDFLPVLHIPGLEAKETGNLETPMGQTNEN